jgi:hypothetical protein
LAPFGDGRIVNGLHHRFLEFALKPRSDAFSTFGKHRVITLSFPTTCANIVISPDIGFFRGTSVLCVWWTPSTPTRTSRTRPCAP